MSRVHQKTRHNSGELERVLGAILVQHLERDRANHHRRESDDRRDRRVLEKIRFVAS